MILVMHYKWSKIVNFSLELWYFLDFLVLIWWRIHILFHFISFVRNARLYRFFREVFLDNFCWWIVRQLIVCFDIWRVVYSNGLKYNLIGCFFVVSINYIAFSGYLISKITFTGWTFIIIFDGFLLFSRSRRFISDFLFISWQLSLI